MPREIKTTLAVDGEQAFKRAINDARTSMRNLGTQLTLAAAEFKKDGDAMKLMETRSKTLKAEITQQEEIVKLRKTQAETRRKLKNVRKELTADIDRLGLTLKVINICLVPAIVILLGLLRGLMRRRH